MARICVFCASTPGLRPSYAEGTRAMARALVAGGHSLVYGGGNVGLMGVVADAGGPHLAGGPVQDRESTPATSGLMSWMAVSRSWISRS